MRRNMNSRSFTLIELLIVIAIIGILAAIIMVTVTAAMARARDADRSSGITEMQKALEEYYIQNGSYPAGKCAASGGSSLGCLQVLVTDGLLSALPVDPQASYCNPATGYCTEYDYQSPATGWDGGSSHCGSALATNGAYFFAWSAETVQNFDAYGGGSVQADPDKCGGGSGNSDWRCCIYVQ